MAAQVLDPAIDGARRADDGSSRHSAQAMRNALIVMVALGVVLRVWRLGFNGLSYDESFTAMAARLPLDQLFDHLRTQDTHPPLDYLLRAPLARAGASAVVLRLPSFACSVGALVLFAWWMRARGLAGVLATAVVAASAFQIHHGGEARMYALLQLLGVAAAVVSERWLRDGSGRCAGAAGALVVVALFDHVSGFLLLTGMLAVAGLRRDRRAWLWRAALGASLALWAAAWASSFAHQAGGDWVGWIPRTSPSSFARAVSGQVTDLSAVAWLVVAAVAAGSWCVWRADGRLARVWVAVGAVPFLAAAAIGVVSPFLIDRAVTVAAWAPAVALGYAAAAAVRWRPPIGRAATAIGLAIVVVGSVSFLATKRYDADLAVEHLEAVAQPGDVIVTRPARYATLPAYRIGVEQWHDTTWVATPGIDIAAAFRAGDSPATGRLWLFTPDSFELDFRGYRACPSTPDGRTEPWTDGLTHVVCLERLEG